MKSADFTTATNGFPLESDATLGFMQTAYTEAVAALAKMKGSDMVVVSGMAETGNAVAAGWIFLNGELIEFMAGTKSTYFIIVDAWVQKANQDGTLYNRYRARKAQFGTGTTQYAYADLQRAESIITLRERLVDLMAMEGEVILKGCEVSAVTVSTLAIAAGTAIIDRKIVTVGTYAGNFPVWLKSDGSFVTTAPAAPFIKFDPHTSQRVADVWRRAMTPIGNVAMQTSLPTDRFDSTGLGKFEFKGFALANGQNGTVNLQGCFPVGQYLGGNSGDPIWDTLYATLGSTGGAKQVALNIENMPAHNHTNSTSPPGGPVPPTHHGLIRRSAAGDDVTTGSDDTGGSGSEPDIIATPQDIPFQGQNTPHENRPPFLVLAFVQRIN